MSHNPPPLPPSPSADVRAYFRSVDDAKEKATKLRERSLEALVRVVRRMI